VRPSQHRAGARRRVPTGAGTGDGSPQAARIATSAGSVLMLAGGLLAGSAGFDIARAVLLTLFCLVGLGSAPFALNPALSAPARIALSFVTGFSVLTAGSMAMVDWKLWHPVAALWVCAVVAVLVHLWALLGFVLDGGQRLWPDRAQNAERPSATLDLLGLLAVAVGLTACVVIAAQHRSNSPSTGGLLSKVGPAWYVGLAITVVVAAGLFAVRPAVQATAVLATGLILTLTPAIVYELPRAQSAEKHIQLVQLFRQTHDFTSGFAVYNAWPGFFSAIAWLCDFAHIQDPISLATFWPALLVVFRISALRYLAGQFFASARAAWGITLIALLVDTLGADYFSPQSVGFVIGLVIYALALSSEKTWFRLCGITGLALSVTVIHQLSPFIIGGVLVVLALFRQLRPWWAPALVVAPAVLWALVHLGTVSGFISLSSIGSLSNFELPSQKVVSQKQLIVHLALYATAGTLLILGGLALAGLIQGRRQLARWAMAVSPVVGVAAVAANAYGNEGTFRAVLFAVPWLAILAGFIVYGRSGGLPVRLVRTALALVLTASFLVAAFGLDGSSVERRGDRAFLSSVATFAAGRPQDEVIVLSLESGDIPTSLPTAPRNLTLYAAGDQQFLKLGTTNGPFDGRVDVVTQALLSLPVVKPGQTDVFAVSSPASRSYSKEYGLSSAAQSAAFIQAFASSPYWHKAFDRDGTIAFRLDADAYLSR
jgi:hypothetical protein